MMRVIGRVLLAAVATMLVFAKLHAQTDTTESRVSFGGGGGIGLNMHTSQFSALPNVPNCCPEFTSGFGVSPYLFGAIRIPFTSLFSGTFRLMLGGFSGALTSDQPTVIAVNGVDTDGTFRHTIEASLFAFGIEPLFTIKGPSVLRFHVGPRFSVMAERSYEQKEELVSPTAGTFKENGLRVRNQQSGELQNSAGAHFGITLGMSGVFSLGETKQWAIEPEVMYMHSLTDVIATDPWKVHQVRFGVSIMHTPPKKEVIRIPDPPRPDTPPPPIPILEAALAVHGVAPDGKHLSNVVVKVEEFVSSKFVPLLNYVFFDSASSTLPARYRTLEPALANRFALSDLKELSTIDMYYHVLNIVGSRLLLTPTASITVVGATSGEASDPGGKKLADARAAIVKNYFVQNWGIKESRIKTQGRLLPEKLSKSTDKNVNDENRRVEILSDDWQITMPIFLSDTLTTTSPSLVAMPTIKADNSVKNWQLDVMANGKQVTTMAGNNTPPASIPFTGDTVLKYVTPTTNSLAFTLHVSDTRPVSVKSNTVTVPVQFVSVQKKRTDKIADTEYDKYSLILFDFDQSALSATNAKIVGIIKSRILPEATVQVLGYTDDAGDAEYNLKLSEERARQTAKMLGIPTASVMGKGESQILYDTSLPEGRFYSRTVEVTVETPIR